mmetsp:Transcript_9209/g.16189  ORF Transcript_9209/g.16189 Transcript_9209/m.16189 type:complete len:91 (-) Transcript_9209:499-771(-)
MVAAGSSKSLPPTRPGCSASWDTHTQLIPLRAIAASTLRVETGSQAEVGSSSRSTEGRKASASASMTLCAWPPERVVHAWLRMVCSKPRS